MVKIVIEGHDRESPILGPSTLMVHREPPSMVVMATGIAVGGDFPGVCLSNGTFSESWMVEEFVPFEGKVTLEN